MSNSYSYILFILNKIHLDFDEKYHRKIIIEKEIFVVHTVKNSMFLFIKDYIKDNNMSLKDFIDKHKLYRCRHLNFYFYNMYIKNKNKNYIVELDIEKEIKEYNWEM